MPTGTFLEAKGFAILSARYVMVKKLFICIYVHFLREYRIGSGFFLISRKCFIPHRFPWKV